MEPRPGLVPPHDFESGAILAEEDLKCRVVQTLKRLKSVFLRKLETPRNPHFELAPPPHRPPEGRKKKRTSYVEYYDEELYVFARGYSLLDRACKGET